MKITQEADYAIRIMIHLSTLGKGHIVDAATISENEGVTLRFTLKILRKLCKENFIRSHRGVNGGYSLLKNPDEMSLKDVIEVIDGHFAINKCLRDENACNLGRTATCNAHEALRDIQDLLVQEFDKVKFSQLINK